MAQPYIAWTEPKVQISSTTYANTSGGTDPFTIKTGALDTTPHKLNNDLITISNKAPEGLKDPDGNDIGGIFYARFNDVDRTDVAAVPEVPASSGNPGSPAVPAHSVYTFVDRGHISLNGGVFELLPFTAGVSPATTVTYTDFAGTGRSPYPASYTTLGNVDQGGMYVCGAYTNIESQYTYTIGTQTVAPINPIDTNTGAPSDYWTYTISGTNIFAGQWGTGATPASRSGTGTPGNPYVFNPASLSGQFETNFGSTTGSAIWLYRLTGQAYPETGWIRTSENRISENYTVGGTYHYGTSVSDVHTGAIVFELLPDTEAIIKSGNVTKTTTGTASWAAGQSRTVTFTCASPHCLTDANNRVYVTGASNNAINGLWNVATVTSDTSFTTKIFAAQCGPATITSSVNIVTYDGIDKAGGILKSSSGGPDLTVIAGGMSGNTQVILKGEVIPEVGSLYTFWGNTTTDQLVGTVEFTGEWIQRSMFTDAGLILNSDTGVITASGEYNAATNIDGGMKEIDHWCPRYVHAKTKALERNDPLEFFKANTSGQHALDQWLNSPMVDSSDNITTFLPIHETFHETIHFTMRAKKNPDHRRTSTFIENQDWIKRDFYIDVFNNIMSDRNEIILDYVDITNKTIVANTDTAFIDSDGNTQTNTEHLANGYSNGVFTNL